ncbi:efflux RND transporter periplasmic adaptor subunit [Neorhodopirellula lusitana]|uniref:biotin/lipoyl-binding protein n=1 Tax=Neorhodopirellula lusitana TaxID=445327 RepID=UPI0038501AF0
MTRSSTSSETTPPESTELRDVPGVVAQIADQSASREEFLQRLAGQLGEWLSAALVAVQDVDWDQPRMLVSNPEIADGIDRQQVRHLLEGALQSVASTEVATVANGGIVMAGQPVRSCSGFTAELLPAPGRCSVLVVQDDHFQVRDRLPAMRLMAACVAAVQQTRFMADASKDSSTNKVQQELTRTEQARTDEAGNELDRLAAVRASLRRFHETLDPTATAYRIASELPRLLPCERAVVLLATSRGRRRKYRVKAISGSAVVDKRSPLVRSLNRLASKVAVMGTPMVLPPTNSSDAESIALDSPSQGTATGLADIEVLENAQPQESLGLVCDALPPQIQEPLEEYLDESGVLSAMVIPVPQHRENTSDNFSDERASSDSAMPLAMIILETFTGDVCTRVSPAALEVAQEASVALTNATRYDDVFALPLRRPLAGMSRSAIRNWAVAIVVCLVGLSAAAWLIRVDHTIIATGTARPVERQAIFASVDGVVDSIEVHDGDRVANGDALLQLENPDVQRESQSLTGQLATATAKLASLRALQLAGNDDPREAAQNTIEQRTLQNEIETLGRRLEINQKMRSDLIVRAPIDGILVGWRLHEKLRSRPVSRGDRLFAVIQPDGEWELDLKLPESRGGEVMQRHLAGDVLPIRFAIETRPTESFEATVESVGGIARRRADGTNVVDVVGKIPAGALQGIDSDGFRGDVDVTAKIVCGQRRLIDSWSEELLAWVYRNVVFRFQ